MKWQYTFARWPGQRTRASSVFRADDHMLQRLKWNEDGSYCWELVRTTPRIKI